MRKLSLMLVGFLVLALPFISSCKRAASNQVEKSILIWHWMTDRDDAFVELARRYKQATGVDVRFQLYAPSDVYSQKVRVGAQTNSLPDIFGVLGDSRDMANFIEAG